MEKLTAMQELFDNLQSIDITIPIGVKEIFLEKEKQQIIDAVYHNCSSMTHYDLPCGEQYYHNYIGTDCPQEQFGISDQFKL